MGGVCFAADEDEGPRYRRSEGGYGRPPPNGYAGGPPMRKMPPGRGPPPGRGGPPPQGGHSYMDERVFMDQKFRRQEEPKSGFDPRGPPAQLPPPQDVFGGRGMRPEKMRQFGAAPSETSTAISDQYGHTARQPSHGGNNLPGGHPFPGAGHPHFPHDGHHGEYTGHQSPMMHHTPPRQHKSPHRPHKSPHRPGFEKYDSNDDHMDGTSTAANFHEMISPRKITQPRDSYDGYDSPERKNTDSKHHMSGYSDDQIPRRKSLSERILEYKHRKLTEDNLEPQSPVGMSDYRQKTISKSADRPDHGSDEQDYGHEQQMKRKKSLQERVAEFKEKRKNSQGAGLSPGLEPRTSLRGHGFERSEGHRGFERNDRSSRSEDRRKSSRKKSRSTDRHGRSSEPRNSYHHEEEAPKKKKKKRKSRRAKDEHYTKRSESPSFSKKVEKRRSFIKPKKKKPAELGSAELVEATVRRISRRNAPREDSNSKNFEDTRPQRRASRRNDRGNDQHEWAIHE